MTKLKLDSRARGGLSVFVARDGARASAFVDALKFFAPEMAVRWPGATR